MKIFVAGASGAIGRRLVPMLAARGHQVVASVRRSSQAPAVEVLGAQAVLADALDHEAVHAALVSTEPDVVVHQLTALRAVTDYRRWDDAFAATNRLRTEGTDNLLDGARSAGVRRVVAQSFGGWSYERRGATIKFESDPLDPEPLESMRETHAALRHLEDAVTAVGGIVLRYGTLYGPGTSFTVGGDMLELVRRRKLPLVGSGAGVWSFLHVDDAASATVAAIERGHPGVYNVADDEPAAAEVWLPALALALGVKPPRRVPAWLGRVAAGEAAVALMTEVRGIANAKARRELGWEPAFPSWRDGMLLAERAAA
jgi:nucleoside-diphosphate-sugar epimerase